MCQCHYASMSTLKVSELSQIFSKERKHLAQSGIFNSKYY
jgi:hypothetical protein